MSRTLRISLVVTMISLACSVFCHTSYCQQTPISAVVTSPNGIAYAFSTGSASIVCPGNQAPSYNGFTVPRNQTITGIDGFGHFAMTVYDVSTLQPVGCAYTFAITAQNGIQSFTTGLIGGAAQSPTITGSSVVDLSMAISAFAVPLPVASLSAVLVNSVQIINPNFGDSPCITWATAGSTIQGTVTPACRGGGGGGGGSNVQVGGVGVASPNFINSSVFQFVLAGSSVTGVPVAPGAEGSIIINHSNAFGSLGGLTIDSATSPTALTDTYLLNQTGNTCFGGPSPYIDITCPAYGARAVASIPTTTATINSGSPTATLASAIALKNGDGFTIIGAGPTMTLSTPSAPTVTPSLNAGIQSAGRDVAAPAGATAYNYCIVARDQNGGQTPCSAVGSTSTGNSMAPPPVAISTLTRSGTTVSAVTSTPHGLATGALAYITQSTDASFSGYYFVTGTTDNLHFTYTQALSTTVAGTSTSATGGTVEWWPSNKVSWTAVPNAWQYYIYGRTGGSLTFLGISRPGDTFWEDYGQTAAPQWAGIPTTAPVSATNDYLVTTICSGAGTTTLTLCGTATNSVTSSFATFDDSPALAAAVATASSTGGTPHFPASPLGTSYYLGSHTTIGNDGITILQSAPIIADETTQFNLSYTWYTTMGGTQCSVQQFSWNCGQSFQSRAAFPGIYSANNFGSAGSVKIEDVAFSASNNGLSLIIGGFNNILRGDTFRVGTGGTDTTGIAVIGYGVANADIENVLFLVSGPNNPVAASTVPALFMRNDTVSNPSSGMMCHHCFFNNRAIAVDSFPSFGGDEPEFIHESYANGLKAPLFATARTNGDNIYINGFVSDTETQPLVANWSTGSGGVFLSLQNIQPVSQESNGTPGIVTGNALNQIVAFGILSPLGQNFNTLTSVNGLTTVSEPLSIPTGSPEFWNMQAPANVACVVGAGGNVPTTFPLFYLVVALDVLGNKSATSSNAPTCTPTAGNQTVTVTWSAVQGARSYIVYRGHAGSSILGVQGCDNGTLKLTTCVDTSLNVDGSVPISPAFAGASGQNANQEWVQTLILLAALNGNPISFTDTISAGVLTGDRTVLAMDSSGLLCITGLQCNAFLDVGVANAYAFCPSPIPVTVYQINQQFTFQAANGNSGASTLNVCSLGAKTIKKNGGTGGSVGADLVTNDIKSGQYVTVAYDGTNFQDIGQLGNGGGGAGTVATTGSPVSPELTCFSAPTTITNCNLSGDVTTTNTGVTTVAKIQTVPVNTTSVQVGQILNVAAGPQYINQYPGVNYDPQSGVTYSIACPGDRLGEVDFTGSSATVFTLPQAGSTACMGSSAAFLVHNGGTAPLTLQATASTIDGIAGATGVQIPVGEARYIYSDNTNFHTVKVSISFGGVNTQTANYAALQSDYNKLIVMNCGSACAVTLPATPPITGETAAGTRWNIRVLSIGASLATVNLNGLTFNGSASVPLLNKYVELDISTDGSNYFGSAPLVAGSGITFTPAPQGLSVISTSGGGSVTNIATTPPLAGGPITTTGTLTCTTCTTNAAALTNNQLMAGAGAQASKVADLTGDVSTSGGLATALATVNGAPGTVTPATFAVNGKGLVTSVLSIPDTTVTIGTTTINANTCTSTTTVTMTGLASTMTLQFTPNSDVSGVTGWGSTGGLVIDAWPTANTANIKTCNQTGANITPSGSVVFNISAR